MTQPGLTPTVGIVTVTYNSAPFFSRFLQSLSAQTQPATRIILVDSGSPDSSFLDLAPSHITILRESNLGFAAGSNLGWSLVSDLDFILFLNPDAFLPPDFLARATAWLVANPTVGMLSPTLLRFDIESGNPLPIVDTTGVIRSRLGLIVERDSGCPLEVLERYQAPNEVPWLCAAVVLARREALEAVLEPTAVPNKPQLFDESFFMYKEDTDLAWRIRLAGWSLIHFPALVGYHCRGWQDRRSMSREIRLLTARNELKMCVKNHSPFVLVAVAKYLVVLTFNV
jgi:N-acetylglucosaminyl-diphospho-decaprenol L-rhamnosyltransferase